MIYVSTFVLVFEAIRTTVSLHYQLIHFSLQTVFEGGFPCFCCEISIVVFADVRKKHP